MLCASIVFICLLHQQLLAESTRYVFRWCYYVRSLYGFSHLRRKQPMLLLCFVIMVLCLCIVSCCVFYVLFFHALMCPLSSPGYFPMFFPLAPSVYCIVPFMFSCAPPLRYHTWPPPSSLSSPVPRLVISVCVFSLCVPLTPCLVIVFVSFCLCPCSRSCACSCLFLVPPRYVFLDLSFAFLIWTLASSLYFALLSFATLPVDSLEFLHSAFIY